MRRCRGGGPCNAQIEAGIVRADRADTYLEADIAATCVANEFGRQAIAERFLVVEILSSSTERHDRRIKLPAYRQIESVQEVVLLASDGVYAELHRRASAQWTSEILQGSDAVLTLTSVPADIRLGELYDGIELSESDD